MPPHRHFLGWDGPALPRVVAWFGEQRDLHRGDGPLIVVPVGRAGRRLQAMLDERGERWGGRWGKRWGARVVTVGELPEYLYTPVRPLGPPLQRRLARVRVLRAFAAHSPESLASIVPDPPHADDVLAWWSLAAELEAASRDLAAGGLGPGDVERLASEHAVDLPSDGRWAALAELEEAYLEELYLGGWSDPQAERIAALREARCRCDRAVVLVGCADLPPLTASMLLSLRSPVYPLVIAPASAAGGFDEMGVIRSAWWSHRELDIDENIVRFVDAPADLARDAARLAAADTLPTTLAVGDEATLAAPVQRATHRFGRAARRSTGRAVVATPPALALSVLGRLASTRRLDRLGDAVRHPDIEEYLETRLSREGPALPTDVTARSSSFDAEVEVTGELSAGVLSNDSSSPLPPPPGVIDLVDRYRAEHLQARAASPWLAPPVTDGARSATPPDAELDIAALWRHLATLAPWAADASSAPERQPLPHWMPLLRDTLSRLYPIPLAEADSTNEPVSEDTELSHDIPIDTIPGLRHLLTAIETLAALPPEAATTPRVTAAQAASLLLAQLASDAIPEPVPDDADPPPAEVVGYLELQLEEAPRIVIVGMNEGLIPSGSVGDAFLPDRLRGALGLPDAARRYARDLYLLETTLAPRQHPPGGVGGGGGVTLLAARHSAQGDPLAPSRLLLACDDATLPKRVLRFYQPASHPTPGVPTSVGMPQNETPTTPPARDLFLIPKPTLAHPEVTGLSASAFADYLACPYRFYLKHILQLDIVDDRGAELDPRQFGNLAHDTLRGFARSPLADSADPDAIADYLEAGLRSRAARLYGRSRLAAINIQLLQLAGRLRKFAEVQAQWAYQGWRIMPRLVEHRRSLHLFVDGRPFTIRGTPDRVDHHPDRPDLGLRILDYKTGDHATPPNAAHQKKNPSGELEWVNLQLPLYHDLIREHLKPEGPIAMGYINLPKKIEDIGYHPADWSRADLDTARAARDTVIRGVRENIFWPPTLTPPRYDDGLGRICGDTTPNPAPLTRDASQKG